MNWLYKNRNQLWLLFACCLGFIFLIRPWQLYFLNDDFLHIPPNDHLYIRGGFLRPVANYVMLMDKALYGTNATGFFFTTLVFHFATVFSVYFLVREILNAYFPKLASSSIALTASIFFLVYPFHAEPLMWLISRGSIMAAFFTFLSLIFYLKAAWNALYLALCWIFFVAMLFTYESSWSVVLLFGIISLADVKLKRLSARRGIFLFGCMLASFLVYLAFRQQQLGTIAGDGYLEINENLPHLGLLSMNLAKLTGRVFTPPFQQTPVAVVFFLVSTVFYACLSYKVYRRNRGVFILLMVLWVAITTGLFTAAPLGIDTHYNEGERYLYYASFFFCFFLVIVINELLSGRMKAVITAAILVVFTVMLSLVQSNYQYASSITKTTLQTVADNTGFKRAFFLDVPKKYKGSMIFRISLPNAIEWITPQADYDSLVILSQVESPSGLRPFKPGTATWQELATAKGFNQNSPVIKTTDNTYHLAKSDVIFWYRNDGIYVVQLP